MEKIRVLIADDHVLFRDGLWALLASAEDTELVGEAASGDEAIAMAAALQPDLIPMDIRMPGANGIDATRQIVRTSPRSRMTPRCSRPCEPARAAICSRGLIMPRCCGPSAPSAAAMRSLARRSPGGWWSTSPIFARPHHRKPFPS